MVTSDLGQDLQVPPNAADRAQGPADAPVTLVEYADYECPYSRLASHVVKGRLRELGDQLRFIYRNFPLRDIHPHAQQAAEAAEAAGAQGRFWAMHDLLFAHQHALDNRNLRAYAAELDLDLDRFNREIADHRYADRIEEDLAGGRRSGVRGTPTFFVNGVRHDGPSDYESLRAVLWEAMAP